MVNSTANKPDDFVIATGNSLSVKEFIEKWLFTLV